MSKPSRGGPRYDAGKKKAKKQPGSQAVAPASSAAAAPAPSAGAVREAVQPMAGSSGSSSQAAVQFRPRAREGAGVRSMTARAASSGRAALQAVDYSYVYTDVKIIGGLATALFGGLIALSFVLR